MDPSTSIRVLCLVPDRAECKLLSRALERLHCSLHFAQSVPEFLGALHTFVPSLLLIDAAISPGGVQALLEEPTFPRYPSVLIGLKPANDASFAWVDQALTRPYTSRQLQQIVRNVLELKTPDEQLSGSFSSLLPPPSTHQDPRFVQLREEIIELLWPKITNLLVERIDRTKSTMIGDITGWSLRESLDDMTLQSFSRLLDKARPGVEVLRGDLTAISAPELLQMISMQKQSGILSIHSGQKWLKTYLCDGIVSQVIGYNLGDAFKLGHYLVSMGHLRSHDLDWFLSQHRSGQMKFGEELVQLGYLSKEDLEKAFLQQSTEMLYEMLRWNVGHFSLFRLSADAPEMQRAARLSLRLEPLLFEGIRRIDEWARIEQKIRPDMIPRQLNKERSIPSLNQLELATYSLVNGQNSVQTILQFSKHNAFEVSSALYKLLKDGLIEV